ncbi:YqcI/YcgG family protein [Paraburkholderia tropica]|uniref:YqcI/YcgG family protein n=1 Tax=Paraburkholderia tropica TaxID=92647 RepID=UPI0009F35BCB|nr:YqcI/YcgG family protein [Paraburkholderia tropica]
MQAEDNGSAAPERRKREVSDWRSRIIVGQQVGVTELPSWLEASYGTLNSIVCAAGYPCFFGTQAERRGEMFYSYLHGKDLSTLPGTMATFARLADQPEYRRNNIAIFFEPDAQPLSHQAYHDHFWGTLQHLHDVDPDQQADFQPDPSDGAWEFSFGGVQMFVVCACPSFSKRHSRNLGPGMVLLFQPRAVFVDTITNKVIGREARNQVRERLRKWDDIEPHPDLGFYGDPGNLEWKQYFLDDANSPAADRCPFLNRARRDAQSADDSTSARAESAGAGSVSRSLNTGGVKGATSEQETNEAEAHAAHARPMSKWQPHSSAHHSGLSALPGPAPFVAFHGEQTPGEQGE